MLSDKELNQLAIQLIEEVDFHKYLKEFEWDNAALSPAWEKRKQLSKLFQDGCANVEEYADEAHRWGFGSTISKDVKANPVYKKYLPLLCTLWAKRSDPWEDPDAMCALIKLLEIDRFKIARVSKLVTFLNQDNYGIYDSRVSYALGRLTFNEKRVFPFVAGRVTGGTSRVAGDQNINGNPKRIARSYVEFLRLVRKTADLLNEKGVTSPELAAVVGEKWNPALVEMALFMYGESREKKSDIARVCPQRTREWEAHCM